MIQLSERQQDLLQVAKQYEQCHIEFYTAQSRLFGTEIMGEVVKTSLGTLKIAHPEDDLFEVALAYLASKKDILTAQERKDVLFYIQNNLC
ncbi:hypothetical protein [Bacillus phage SPO1L4]|uniref:Uncharacterized protein n=1 Tax=Bacillus phage vB_BsuM-Goe2 TaxID=1933062 RepID=A0A217EQW1_9CAUD|nr:hypothetical protein Goe2_c01200 [Bacillus phage vB_BsuM-Goe2]APZ82450.1 hypothetical protein Goe2_c21400 [Bacillus phage vB_BsuM-Goe2]WIT26344.1 hypothetical protein [Bacillus phage SPO1L3]WIT26544.1 hypothetical protein [Bacillus phage SPO1L4]WIT26743.1 hypothetical protein [Bacillus phage SPO1L5]